MSVSHLPMADALAALEGQPLDPFYEWVAASIAARCGAYHVADVDLTLIATASDGELTSLQIVRGLGPEGCAELHRGLEQGLLLALLPVTARPV